MKSDTKKATRYDPISMTFWERRNQNQMGNWLWANRHLLQRGMKELSTLNVVVFTWLHICQNSENYTSKEGGSYTVYFTKLDLKTVAFYVILGDTIVNNASDTNEPEQIIFKELVSNPTVAAP